LWVLTGDKIETAINIGYSAGLLDDTMLQHIVDDETEMGIKSLLKRAELDFERNPGAQKALIIAGDALSVIQKSERLQEHMLDITDRVSVVLACRVSPKQKADIVEMVKKRFPKKKTLSIGDGANDVPMITKADVGVGIAGKEGM
jgi:magnesium-transporting ATPase (P-type)